MDVKQGLKFSMSFRAILCIWIILGHLRVHSVHSWNENQSNPLRDTHSWQFNLMNERVWVSVLWLWAVKYGYSYWCTVINASRKSDYKTEYLNFKQFFRQLWKTRSFIRSFNLIRCCVFNKWFVCTWKALHAITTLQFNGAYNIPFASVYWFTSFKPMKCFVCTFFCFLSFFKCSLLIYM